MENNNIFYSEGWQQTNVATIAFYPYFDLRIDKEYLYLIKLPKYISSFISMNNHTGAIGAIILSLALIIGFSTGIVSRDYKKDIFIKVPLNDIRGNIAIGNNKFTLTYGGKVIVLARRGPSFRLQKNQKNEFDQFKKNIEKYVL